MAHHRSRGVRRQPRRTPFNMIEIILALGVIAVGVISILALFPIGLTASRDAMADSNGADVGDQMIHQLEYMSRANWTAYVGTSGSTGAIKDTIPSDASVADFDISSLTPIDYVASGTTPGTMYQGPTADVYKVVRYIDSDGNRKYTTGEIVDFAAVIKVWKRKVQIPTVPDIDYLYAVRYCVELSWPAQLPYAQRQKSYYTKELFNRL